jgi:hypothetical protein
MSWDSDLIHRKKYACDFPGRAYVDARVAQYPFAAAAEPGRAGKDRIPFLFPFLLSYQDSPLSRQA